MWVFVSDFNVKIPNKMALNFIYTGSAPRKLSTMNDSSKMMIV